MSAKATVDADKEVGRRVKVRRLELGMSQETLGNALGLTFQQVQKYEKGTNRIGAGRLQHIAKILEVPVAFFFSDGKGGADQGSEVFALLETAYSLRLVKAFSRIDDRRIQRTTVELVEEIAKSINGQRYDS